MQFWKTDSPHLHRPSSFLLIKTILQWPRLLTISYVLVNEVVVTGKEIYSTNSLLFVVGRSGACCLGKIQYFI